MILSVYYEDGHRADHECKWVTGGIFGENKYVLTSIVSKESGIWEAEYWVMHYSSGYPVSKGETKTAALNAARETLAGIPAENLRVLFEEKTANQERLKAEEEARHKRWAESLPLREKPRLISAKRRKVFNEAGGVCFYCKAVLNMDGVWHIEHKIPRSRGGTDLADNLTASCVECNNKKRTMTDEEFLRAVMAA